MKRRVTVSISFFICCVLSHLVSPNQIDAKGPFHGQVGTAIERSFGTGNPSHLEPYLPHSNKIFLSMPIANLAPGHYSRAQIIAMLKKVFERFVTRGFSLQGGLLPNLQRGPIRAEWTFWDKHKQAQKVTSVYFTVTSNPIKPLIKSIRGETQ